MKTIWTAAAAEEEIQGAGSPERAAGMARFFKTGPGGYAEGDVFLGVGNPGLRALVKKYRELPMKEVERLLNGRFHEVRLCGLLILVDQYARGEARERERIFRMYERAARAGRVNNWDLVDLSAPGIAGERALTEGYGVLEAFADRPGLWEPRIAMVGSLTLIRHGDFQLPLALARRFLGHPHDLMHKACGWMLREVGKRDRRVLTAFLEECREGMPRTMLRYAIEHYPEADRQRFLARGARRG